MAYFWDELDFLTGGRFTDVTYMSLRQWPAELDAEIVLLGQFLWLVPGQHVDVEEDFLASHLPLHRAVFGGLDEDDDPWLFSIQAVPSSAVREGYGPDADPYDVMREHMAAALTYNAGAHVQGQAEWSRDDLIAIYGRQDIHPRRLGSWRTFDLLRGLLAELTGVELTDIVRGYPTCAFPGQPHGCRHDVFDDALHAWAARQRG